MRWREVEGARGPCVRTHLFEFVPALRDATQVLISPTARAPVALNHPR